MNDFLEILKYVLPAGVVFATSYYLLKQFLDNEYKRELMQARINHQKVVTPIRLQAFERLSILLERINPSSMVMRVHNQNMSARQLQSELLKTIRTEFEHNLSQQVYVSNQTWESVRAAKEETIKIINLASARVSDSASSLDLAKIILDLVTQLEKMPHQVALENLKREVKQLF
jgi:hypothetical protein